MTYYPDLSSYDYSAIEPDVLNIGWLKKGQPFPTGPTSTEFQAAFASCALNPTHLCRGTHVCDLCTRSECQPYDFDGRHISGGNGEIRVTSPSGTEFAAPTLILHYVTYHQYQPPNEFIEAVLTEARNIYVVKGPLLKEISKMNTAECYLTCLNILSLAMPELATTSDIDMLRNCAGVFKTFAENPKRLQLLEILQQFRPDPTSCKTLYSLWYSVTWFLTFAEAGKHPSKKELAINRVARSFERANRLGITVAKLEAVIEAKTDS